MNMALVKQILIMLIINILNANADNECEYQLKVQGNFKMDSDKTQAFMYAYFNLTYPDRETNYRNIKGILHDYQKELLDKFLIAHKEHLEKMFDHPMNWCIQHLDTYRHRNKNKSDVQNCIDAMNNGLVNDLHVSRENALNGLFSKLIMQRNYMEYVGSIIIDFVKYTSARSPENYCNHIESIHEKIIFVNDSGNWEENENSEYNQSLTTHIDPLELSSSAEYSSARIPQDDCHNVNSIPEKNIFVNDNRNLMEIENSRYNQSSTSIHQKTHFPFDLNSSFESSSSASKSIMNFDLNQIPPDENE